jgi:hypothetical protein
MRSGRNVTISGQSTSKKVKASMIKKYGKAARETSPSDAFVRPWITKRFMPTGGVTIAISTATTRYIPNHSGLNPAA